MKKQLILTVTILFSSLTPNLPARVESPGLIAAGYVSASLLFSISTARLLSLVGSPNKYAKLKQILALQKSPARMRTILQLILSSTGITTAICIALITGRYHFIQNNKNKSKNNPAEKQNNADQNPTPNDSDSPFHVRNLMTEFTARPTLLVDAPPATPTSDTAAPQQIPVAATIIIPSTNSPAPAGTGAGTHSPRINQQLLRAAHQKRKRIKRRAERDEIIQQLSTLHLEADNNTGLLKANSSWWTKNLNAQQKSKLSGIALAPLNTDRFKQLLKHIHAKCIATAGDVFTLRADSPTTITKLLDNALEECPPSPRSDISPSTQNHDFKTRKEQAASRRRLCLAQYQQEQAELAKRRAALETYSPSTP